MIWSAQFFKIITKKNYNISFFSYIKGNSIVLSVTKGYRVYHVSLSHLLLFNNSSEIKVMGSNSVAQLHMSPRSEGGDPL